MFSLQHLNCRHLPGHLALLALALCAVQGAAMDSYNASTNTLSIPYVLVGNTLYTNVNVTVGDVLGVGASTGQGGNDVYSVSSGQLLVNSVQVGSAVFNGVTITIKNVLSVGGSWPTATLAAGTKVQGVAVTPDGSTVLATSGTNPGSVSVISAKTSAVMATIPVGPWPGQVAITPDGQTAVVANGSGANNLSVINLATNKVVRTLAANCIATSLYDIAITPNGNDLVMGDLSSGCTSDGLDILNLSTGGITFVNTPSFNGPLGVAVTPDGSSVLATAGATGSSIRRISLSTLGVTTISGTSSSFGVAVTPDGSKALVTSGEGDTVKVINLASNTVTAAIPFASNQNWHNIAITPDGTMAVVVGDYDIGLLSLASNTVLVDYPRGGSSVAIAPSGKYALVTDGSDGNLFVIDLP